MASPPGRRRRVAPNPVPQAKTLAYANPIAQQNPYPEQKSLPMQTPSHNKILALNTNPLPLRGRVRVGVNGKKRAAYMLAMYCFGLEHNK